jgi:hypothetical protein
MLTPASAPYGAVGAYPRSETAPFAQVGLVRMSLFLPMGNGFDREMSCLCPTLDTLPPTFPSLGGSSFLRVQRGTALHIVP